MITEEPFAIFTCTLPGRPISGGHRIGFNPVTGKRYRTSTTTSYERCAGIALVAARVKQKWATARWVFVRYTFWNMDGTDHDNLIKSPADCMQRAAIYENDRYTLGGLWRYRWDANGPRIDVEVTALDPAACGIPAAVIARSEAAAERNDPHVRARRKKPVAKPAKKHTPVARAMSGLHAKTVAGRNEG